MNRLSLLGAAAVAIALAWLASDPAGGVAPQPSRGLPGARPVIDASRYPSLQAALDALPPEGGLVRLPPGIFEIDKPLVIRTGDTCIEGSGGATHIQNVNTQGQPALVLADPLSQEGRRSRDHELWRIRLANFRITGNPASGHGVVARGINELFIDGVTISYHGGDGIHMDHCYEDPRICDSLITYNKQTGLNLNGCHDIVVAANQFEENQDAVRCADSFNLTMTGNNVDDHLGAGVVIENTYGSVVAGNMIEECQGPAIVLDRDCYGITLSANVIAHNGAGVQLPDAHGCAVSANTFTINKADAVRVGPDSGRIAISGNSFCNSYVGEGNVARNTDDLEAGGLVLDGAAGLGVSGNVFSSVRPKALELTGSPSRNVLFSGNLLVDAPSDHPQLKESLVEDNLETDKPRP